MPREVEVKSEVLGGFINKNGVLTVEVTKPFGESRVSKILELVENASSKKAPTEKFISKFARYYTPVVVIIALLLAVVRVFLEQINSRAEFFIHPIISFRNHSKGRGVSLSVEGILECR